MTKRDTTVAPTVAISQVHSLLGAHASHGFDARGARVVPLVREVGGESPAGARRLDDVLGDPKGLAGIDVFVHAATERAPYGVDAEPYRAANVALVERSIRACAIAGVRRVVLVSSVGVYGFPSRLPVAEGHPYAPRTPAAATEVEVEMRARRVSQRLGIELVIVRQAIVYGPNDPGGLLQTMAAMIRAGTYRVVGSGSNVLHHVHVDDAVDGLWLAATRPEAANEHFIVAGPETTTLAGLSSRVAKAIGRDLPSGRVPGPLARAVATAVDLAVQRGVAFTKRPAIVNHEKLDGLTLPCEYDVTKARRVLGYAPRVAYEEGVLRALRGEWPSLARAGVGT